MPIEPFMLPASADCSTVTQGHAQLQEIWEATPAITLDGSSVNRMTTPYVQLLAVASADAAASGKNLRLVNATPVVQEAFSTLGLTAIFQELTSHD